MKNLLKTFATICVLGCALQAAASDSMLRVACEADAEGADITVDGKFKGQCPVDLKLAPGTHALRAEKKAGPDHILVYERDVRIGDGVVQRLNLTMTRKLTEDGRVRAAARNKALQNAYALAVQEHQQQQLTQQAQVQACASKMATDAHARMMNCWTNSGGCVGPWPCENSQKRMQRCSSNGKGGFDESEFIGTCRSRVRQVPAPVAPKLETD